MLTLKQGIKLSAIIDKLDINIDFKNLVNEKGEIPQEVAGAELITQMIMKLHKAENEIYAFVAEYKKCSIEEAEEIDIVDFFKSTFGDSHFSTFFKSAVKSKLQG